MSIIITILTMYLNFNINAKISFKKTKKGFFYITIVISCI